ncbi:hypothetical protein WA158_001997 [Blastocystis sp. Blastoise]
MSDKKEGKCCLIATNVILLIIGLVILGVALYFKFAGSFPVPEVEAILAPSLLFFIVTGVVICVLAILGWCAAGEGCWLYTYSFLVFIVFIVALVATIFIFVLYVLIQKANEHDGGLWESITQAIWAYAAEDTKGWKEIQDGLKCCGFGTNTTIQTGTYCGGENATDCLNLISQTTTSYALWAGLGFAIATLVLLILVCSSCRLMCSCGNKNSSNSSW